MRTIHKQILAKACGEQTLKLPGASKFLTLDYQKDNLCLWYECDPSSAIIDIRIRTYGTGHTIDPRDEYIGTYQMMNGELIFHIYWNYNEE